MRWTLFLVLLPLMVFGQPAGSPESPVDLQHEPHHHLVFENEFVRAWDTLIPAKQSTLWHTHSNNNVVLTLSDADVRVETVGADPAETHPKLGDVGFRKATYTHRTMSIGSTDFRNMAIEILFNPEAKPDTAKDASAAIDNEQVRVYRVSLAPGESTGMKTRNGAGLLVAITPGDLEITETKMESVSLKASDLRWRSKTVSQAIKNTGTTQFEAVDIELKQ